MISSSLDKEYTDFMKAYKPYQPVKRRPLRTYGRATVPPAPDDEPPRKKRVVEVDCDAETDKENIPSSPKLPELPPQPPVAAKKGSILAFFKPIFTSGSVPASGVSSDQLDRKDEALVSSPPSSPPVPRAVEKKKRRLGTRGLVRSSSPAWMSENEGVEEHKATVEAKVKPAAKRRTTRATIQTTLALSMKDDPAFTICKDCEMLYNPLNDKDRKDHARRHAAALREKEKLVEGEW